MSGFAAAQRRAELRRWAQRFPAATPIADLEPRRRAACVGVVHKIRLEPAGGGLSVTLDDGTGRLEAVWTGRPRLDGLELGGGMGVEGTVLDGAGTCRVVRNPSWWPVAEPYVTRSVPLPTRDARRPRALLRRR